MKTLACALFIFMSSIATAANLSVNDAAPVFATQNQAGFPFDLNSRRGKWTVLYFYPKAGTPGCTKQACAFRDSIKKIRDQGAEVYGVSGDSIKELFEFHKEHNLNFDLLSDPKAKILESYGTKMFGLNISKRWTFILDPKLVIRSIDKDVDPVLDADKVAKKIAELKK